MKHRRSLAVFFLVPLLFACQFFTPNSESNVAPTLSALPSALSTPLPETNAPDSQATEGASPVSDEADTYQIGWITFLDDPFYHDFAVSPDGAIYVTTINQPPVNQNCYLSKFDENGGAQWKVLIATLEYGVCGEIVFDQSGNIYVSGSDPLAWGGSNDISGNVVFVAKFNPDGVNLQNYLITDIPNNLIGDSVSFEIDSKGNIYISSNEYDEYSKTAFSLIKFNPAGDIEWKKTYSSQWRYFPYHIKTDKNGRVFVYGSISYEDALGKNEGDCFLSLITPDGDMEWSVTLGSEESHDGCSDLVVNDIGDAYVSGSSNAAWGDPLEPWGNPYIDPESGGFLQFIAKISQNGDIVWNTFVESTANLTLDADGNIIIPSPDIVQMDADGSIFRQSIFQGTSEEYFLSFSGLKFDSQNNIYAIGESNGPYDSLNVINPPAEDGGSSDLFIAKVALDDGTYRPGGPFVPEITRHIPTPLDIAMSFLAIWSNLFLAVVAAALMLPFALIIDIFSETLKSISNLALKFWAEIRAGILKYISIPTTANQRLFIEVFKILAGILRLFLIILFYGLIFSFLDPEWTPFSSEGWLLVFEMAIAASIVGILDDMIQWAVIRSWGLPGSLNVRFTNVLASIASVGISRLIPIVPGLMFGSPEALVADEDKFTRKQSNTLTQITVFTFAAICLAAWIPTIFLELIIRADPAEWLKDIAAGMEGFLLIIFAVALENVFVQLMGVSEGLGKKIRQQSILGWAILWTPVAFMFLHTLLNPRNDFLEKVQHGDPFVFVAATIFIMAAAMIFAGLIRLLFWAFKRK